MVGQVSVREVVGAAFPWVRAQWRVVLIASAIGALAMAAITVVGVASPIVAIAADVAGWLVQAFVYSMFLQAALSGKAAFDAAVGLRVFAAMMIVGFFLFLAFFVLMIPGAMVLLIGPMSPYLHDMQQAGQDQAAMMQVVTRFAQENPAPLLAFIAFYAILWFLLTSRLYLAAPATAAAKRVLTFDTWAWTRGHTLKIVGARIMLMAPAFVLMATLTYLAARLLGIDLSSAASAAAPQFSLYVAFDRMVFFAVYLALEAGLSVALYRALKPGEAAKPTA